MCEIDLRVGGAYRYVWRKESTGAEMAVGGTFREIVPPQKLVITEKFDDAWYPGEAITHNLRGAETGITTVRLVVAYESREARDIASRSGMERGMIAGFDRLEQFAGRWRQVSCLAEPCAAAPLAGVRGGVASL